MPPPRRLPTLDAARRGDAQALGELLESYRPYLRVLVRGLADGRLRGRLDESDLIQEALLEAHRAFPRFRGTASAELTAWLRQVVLRSAARVLRAHLGTDKRDAGREEPLGADPIADGSTPSDQAQRHEHAALMARALERLPDDTRLVLLGRHVDDLPYAALAQRLGRSEGAIRVLYTRALRRLRDECRALDAPEGTLQESSRPARLVAQAASRLCHGEQNPRRD